MTDVLTGTLVLFNTLVVPTWELDSQKLTYFLRSHRGQEQHGNPTPDSQVRDLPPWGWACWVFPFVGLLQAVGEGPRVAPRCVREGLSHGAAGRCFHLQPP